MIDRDAIAALIAEGRKHDEAMTCGPWSHAQRRHPNGEVHYDVVLDDNGESIATDPDCGEADFVEANADGIAWTRNNLHALLDGCTAALAEVDRLQQSTQDRQAIHIANSAAMHGVAREIESLYSDARRITDERDAARAEIDRMRPIVTAAIAMRGAPWCEDCEFESESVDSAVDTYRAKGGK